MATSAVPRPIRLHAFLLIALAVAVLVAVFAPVGERWTLRAAAGWDAGVVVFLALTFLRLARTQSTDEIRQRATDLDQAGTAVLPLSLLAAVASVGVVMSEAVSAGGSGGLSVGEALTALGTVALSWTFVHVIFALHYAHRYYGPANRGDPKGLIFPGDGEPDYWDFLHFALIIGVASQTADIQISDKGLRRLSTLHSLTAFLFNTVILALTVNFAVGLIG